MTQGYVKMHNGTPLEFEIMQTGLYRGKTANLGWQFGRRQSGWTNTTDFGDVCEYLGTTQATINTPTPGVQYYVRSSNAADSAAGTGIRSVYINYLKTDGTRTIVEITLAGLTAVPFADDVKFIQYMESGAVGSSGVAAGDIAISSVTTAPTVAQIMEFIKTGSGRSLSGRVMVPKDFTLYMLDWRGSAIGQTMDVRMRSNVYTHNRELSSGIHFQEVMYLASGQFANASFDYLAFPAGALIKISAVPGAAAAGNRCDVGMKFLLIQE